jgi:hypothetical protein
MPQASAHVVSTSLTIFLFSYQRAILLTRLINNALVPHRLQEQNENGVELADQETPPPQAPAVVSVSANTFPSEQIKDTALGAIICLTGFCSWIAGEQRREGRRRGATGFCGGGYHFLPNILPSAQSGKEKKPLSIFTLVADRRPAQLAEATQDSSCHRGN